MAKIDTIRFAFAQLALLQNMRSQNATSLNGFILELFQALPVTHAPDATAQAPVADVVGAAPTGRIKSLCTHLRRHFDMARQARAAVQHGQDILLYGVEPNRLDLRVSKDLGDLVQAHIAPDLSGLTGWFDRPAVALGFDPKTALAHLGVHGHVTTPTLSPLAIMLIGLTRLYRTNPFRMIRAAIQGYKALGAAYPNLLGRLRSVAALCLFMNGIAHLIRPAARVRFLTLTSNSVFLEALRGMILADPKNHVVEIKHGIGSHIFDPYLHSFSSTLDQVKGGRFDIHPLLPAPFCHPPIHSQRFNRTDQASNTGVFKALHCLGPDGISPLDQMSTQLPQVLDRIWQHAAPFCQDGRPIFAILGGTDLSDDFYLGDAFTAEICLVEQARHKFEARGMDMKYLYLPHPANRPLSQLRFADGQDVEISYKSQISYFFADYALSLYSSAIFEAAAFGSRAFCAMPASSGFFHTHMMRRLFTPEQVTPRALDQALDRFCASPTPEAADHKAKIAQRLDRVFNDAVSLS